MKIDATSYDVVVVGSGAGGMVAALRAHDLGLKPILIEKHYQYGGTSATSGGGIWTPCNDGVRDLDTPDKALAYLKAITRGQGHEPSLRAFVDNAHVMMSYIQSLGVNMFSVPGYADYFSEVPGNLAGRAMAPGEFDGKRLGDEFFRMRESYPIATALGRYAMTFAMAAPLMTRSKGWRWQAMKMVAAYWIDIPWRLKTRLDRRLTAGRSLVGALRKAMLDRHIPLLLNTTLVGIEKDGEQIVGIAVERNGARSIIGARAVILTTGGFDQNQEMRDRYHPVKTWVVDSLAPDHGNEGDGIRLGQEIGAGVDDMDKAWWSPTVRLPGPGNTTLSGQLWFDRGRPGSICVNRLGKRFTNDASSYDLFGYEMIRDHAETGANLPCWMIFDSRYRQNYSASQIMPGWVTPDRKLPPNMWDSILYRANTVEELAGKIDVNANTLAATVKTFNGYAKTGKDLDFRRGETAYDRVFGDARRAKPNPNLGPINKAPFYAIRLQLGDLGTKGGLKIDEFARVLDTEDRPIAGLYAAGNTAAPVFKDTYPGAGGTLGPAMTFAYIAAEHVAGRLTNRHPSKAA